MALRAALVLLSLTELSICFPVRRIHTPVYYYYNHYRFTPTFYIPVFIGRPKPHKPNNPTVTLGPRERPCNHKPIFILPSISDGDEVRGDGNNTQGQSKVPFFVYPNEVANNARVTGGGGLGGGKQHESIDDGSLVVLPGVLVRVPDGGE